MVSNSCDSFTAEFLSMAFRKENNFSYYDQQWDKNYKYLHPPFEGMKFPSFDAVKHFLTEYANQNGMKFWVRSSHTLCNAKSELAKKANPNLKFMKMKFACIYGGEKIRYRGKGIRNSGTLRDLGCPCQVLAVLGEDGNHVKLGSVNLEHNHDLDDGLSMKRKKLNLFQRTNDGNNYSVNEESVQPSDDACTPLVVYKPFENENSRLLIVKTPEKEEALEKEPYSQQESVQLKVKGKICRLCLLESDKISPIFDPEKPIDSTFLSFKIMGCAAIDLRQDDGLPNTICDSCKELLDVAFNFRLQCENSDTTLREMNDRNTIKNNTIKEELEGCNFGASLKVEAPEENLEANETLETLEENIEGHVEVLEEETGGIVELVGEHILKCSTCNSGLITLQQTLDHITVHDNVSFVCNLCDRIYNDRDPLYDIVGHSLADKIPLTEQICCLTPEHNIKTCASCNQLSDALQENQIKKQNSTFLCTICGKILKTKDRFISHRNSHEGLKPYICSECGKGFADKKNMSQHFDTVHLKKAKHQCPICLKNFSFPNKMKTHMTLHSNLRPFSCTYCDKTFRLKMNMRKHLKIHTNNRPHKCSLCKSAFIDKNMLKRHMYVHGGLRPFVCHVCGHRFPVKFRLKKHLEKSHPQTLQDFTWVGGTDILNNEETSNPLNDVEVIQLYNADFNI